MNYKHLFSVLFAILLVLPLVYAGEVPEEECGLMNLGSCIPEKMYRYTLIIMNAPLEPVLYLIQNLLSEPVNFGLFVGVWAVMVYIISMFYGLLVLYVGFNFMISGHDVAKRENAKGWLKNILMMVVLVQASFFLYSLMVDVGSLLTASVVGMIDANFFFLTIDNFANMGLEIIFTLFYLIVLFATMVLLAVRYVIVCVGVVFFPFAIFFYFIPPLRGYGRFILNALVVNIFITFIASIMLLACSMLMSIPIFENFKILVMIVAFSLVNLLIIYAMKFVITKSAVAKATSTVKGVVHAVKYFA